jgi:acyl-CoA dehydrogenase
MNFDFSPDQKALRDQARKFLSEHASSTKVRRILDTETPYDAELWRGMAEMGWTGTAIPEVYGGAGFGYLELCVLAEELGRAVAPAPFASTIYLATEALLLAGSEAQKRRWLPRVAAGEAIGCFAYAEGPQAPSADDLATTARDGALTGTKAPVVDGDVADFAVVAARDGDAMSLYVADLREKGVSRRALRTVDPTRSVAAIVFAGTPAEPLGGRAAGTALAQRVLDRAAVLVAFEQVGGGQAALDMAREYAVGRFAFGRPIASFQAIKHKLADMYVAIELARSNAYYGAWALSTDAPDLPVAAAAARVSASEAYFHAAKENIQTHGGMGFTWEFDCHLHYRRAKLLGLMLGGVPHWKDLLISRIETRAESAASLAPAHA